MIAGSIEIQMMADIARLKADMDKADSLVGYASSKMSGAVDSLKGVFVGLGAGLSIAALVSWTKAAIDGAGAAYDMSIQTGMSVAALQAFKSVGAYTETTMEAIAGASLKLSKNLATTDEEGKGAALAIKALGLNFDEFRKLSPEDRMMAAAKALDQFEDGADKSAAAMLLFGKEGAKMLPFLKDLADQSDQVQAKLSEQEIALRANQAAMADAFGDNLTAIRKNSEGWKKDLAMGLLPVLFEFSQVWVDMNNGAGGFKERIGQLAKDGTLAEWGRNIILIFSYISDAVQIAWRVIETVVKAATAWVAGVVTGFSSMGSAIMAFVKGDYAAAAAELKNGFGTLKGIGVAAGESIADTWSTETLGSQFRGRMEDMKGMSAAAKEAKKQLDLSETLAKNEEAKKAEKEATKRAEAEQRKLNAAYEAAGKAGQALVKALELKGDELEREIDLGRKLTPMERELLKLSSDMASGKVRLTAEEEKNTRALIANNDQKERQAQWSELTRKANEESRESLLKSTLALEAEVDKQRESNSALMKTKDQIVLVEIARLQALATQRESIATLMQDVDWTGKTSEEYRKQAQALRDLAALKQQGIHVQAAKEAQDAWQKTTDSIYSGLTDSLYRAFEAGKGFFETLWDGIKNTFKTTALKLIIQGADGKSGIVGTVMDYIGLAKSGSGGSLGGLGNIGSLLSSIGSGASAAWSWLTGASAAGSAASGALIGGEAGIGLGAAGGSTAGGGLASMGMSIPIIGAIIAGMFGANKAFDMGYTQDNLNYLGAGSQQKVIGKLLTSLGMSDRISNVLTGGSLTDRLLNLGAGTKHTGASSSFSEAGGLTTGAGLYGVGAKPNDYSVVTENLTTTIAQSVVGILDSAASTFGQKVGYRVAAGFADDVSSDPAWGALSIDLAGQLLGGFGATGHGKWPGKEFANKEEGIKQFIAESAVETKRVLDSMQLPEWAREIYKAIGGAPSLEQLAAATVQVAAFEKQLDSIGVQLGPLGGVFSAIAGLSSDATYQLVQFAGGIDALMAKAKTYVDLYYTDAEKAGLQAAQVKAALEQAGFSSDLASKEDFRALMDSLADKLDTEAGAKQFNALLNVNESFAAVAEYLKAQGGTLNSLAAAAPQVVLLEQIKASSADAMDYQQLVADGVVKLDETFVSVGDNLREGTDVLRESLESGLAIIAANTAAIQRFFDRYDGGEGLLTQGVPG